MKVEIKTRKRYPQQYLMYEARRYYADKDADFIFTRVSKMVARILAADETLAKRGERPVLTAGTREALDVVFRSFTPREKRVAKGGRRGKAQGEAGG